MKLYIQDLANRLSQFSEKLDNTTLFVDKPWVLIDENENYHKYIFKKNGELIMSVNGQAQIGKWEYLVSAKSILIDRIKDKILLNHSFFDQAVMVLRIDGTNSDMFILANEIIIPDLDVKKYLQSINHKKFNILAVKLINGKTLEVYGGDDSLPRVGMKAAVEGEELLHVKYQSERTKHFYEIKNGKIFKITYPNTYKITNGVILTIEKVYFDSISKGDLVYINNQPAASGKYKLSAFKSIKVINGVITDTSLF